ncbi:MAG: histidine phosphatase family protein [Actinomycetota bacterium]|jgi:broad specificity phosphatase PhoE
MIHLIRHGQSTSNAANLLVGRGDTPLSDTGREQALALRPYLANVVEVWSSPLQRAKETAALAVPHIEAKVQEAFIEVDYGSLDGQPLSTISSEEWRAFEHDHDLAFGGGESLHQVDSRVHAALDELLEDTASLLHDSERHLVIVSHMSPVKSAVAWALGVPGSVAWRTRVSNASISTIVIRSGSPSLMHFNMVPPAVR